MSLINLILGAVSAIAEAASVLLRYLDRRSAERAGRDQVALADVERALKREKDRAEIDDSVRRADPDALAHELRQRPDTHL